MFRYPRSFAVIATIFLNCGAVLAQVDGLSANAHMPGCRAFVVADDRINSRLLVEAGQCAGLIEGIAFGAAFGNLVCAKPAITIDQLVRVVVKYIDDRPARLHENFKALAIEALALAFPCKK